MVTFNIRNQEHYIASRMLTRYVPLATSAREVTTYTVTTDVSSRHLWPNNDCRMDFCARVHTLAFAPN